MKKIILLGIIAVVIGAFFVSQKDAITSLHAELFVPKANVLFVGDIMLDRSIRQYAEKNGGDYLFSCASTTLRSYDAVIGNLEGPITNFRSVSVGSAIGSSTNTQFTFASSSAHLLARHNFKAVSLGNNHSYNFGTGGIEQTKQYLDQAKIGHFGELMPKGNTTATHTLEIKGVKINLVSYNEWFGTSKEAIAQISTLKGSGPVVVFAHWGDEYVPAPARVKKLARAFVDAGASFVVGAHPHVIQEIEEYKGVPIFYSLGNFIFDQYWKQSVRTGLALDAVITAKGVERVTPKIVYLERNRQTCFK